VNAAELRAARCYRRRGFRILGANVWIAGYELDLVVRRGRRLIFCEVKSKYGPRFGDPLEMVTARKISHVRQAAAAWLQANKEHGCCRVSFDVVVERSGKLQRIADAF
jgi:putative endonuclease